ncbi:hypothetical protein [Vibrio parahaemolyticus]|uniref:hypothetical protein n=1 Tax=Vibrio parahaemolyticus TaxID=670 RepID=UPI002361D655|nr:hypothetical protein [Vibrio parahaemolyticus]MDG2642451.1 hypothetical protein [Vibrio parahaemolyticus]MDG2997271.1 hypothetical protein [Vibrio parahaemolyticus]
MVEVEKVTKGFKQSFEKIGTRLGEIKDSLSIDFGEGVDKSKELKQSSIPKYDGC